MKEMNSLDYYEILNVDKTSSIDDSNVVRSGRTLASRQRAKMLCNVHAHPGNHSKQQQLESMLNLMMTTVFAFMVPPGTSTRIPHVDIRRASHKQAIVKNKSAEKDSNCTHLNSIL